MNYNCTVTATIMNVLYNVACIPTVIFSNCEKKKSFSRLLQLQAIVLSQQGENSICLA